MSKSTFLLLLGTASTFLSGCVTNGDPRTGGIFWSESANRERIRYKEDELYDVESDTDRVRSRNRRLEGTAARHRRTLGE